MISRLTIALLGFCFVNGNLFAGEISASEDAPLIKILVVQAVDRQGGQILFERQTNSIIHTKVRDGQPETTLTYIPMQTAFTLKNGAAITADGRQVQEADLWNRIKPGNPVVVLSPDAVDRDEGGQAIRKLFKDDTILLIGGIEDVPVPKRKAKKR